MECWQTVDFWIGVGTGIFVTLVSVAWSMWMYGQGKMFTTEKSEIEE